MKAVRLLLNKKVLWSGLAALLLTPFIWLGWTQPWQYQPQVPTGPLPERTAERPVHPLPPEVQAAKDEGMRLWGLHEWVKMKPFLEEAAEHGDAEAMYFLGEAHRRQRGFSTVAMEWYTQAAKAGEVYGMMRLHQAGVCRNGEDPAFVQYCADDLEPWSIKAYEYALPLAEAGNTEAMMILHIIVGGGWLQRAAEADNPEAQLEVGNFIAEGIYPNWPYYRYWSDDARLGAALPWYRRAAELGYPPAMDRLSNTLHRLADNNEFWEWTGKAAQYGHISQNLRIAACYINPQWSPSLICPVSQDTVKGLGILIAVRRQAGERATRNQYFIHDDIIRSMADEQRAEAEAFSYEWEERMKAPLSRFPARWGM